MSGSRTLFSAPDVTIADCSCGAGADACALETVSSAYRLLFTREGAATLRAVGDFGGRITADPVTAVLLHPGAYCIARHVAARPHHCTVVAISTAITRALAAETRAFLPHSIAGPRSWVLDSRLLMSFRLIRRAAIASQSPTEVAGGRRLFSLEEECVALLRELLQAPGTPSSRRRGAQPPCGPSTHRRHRHMVERVKRLIASEPAERHSLETLAATVGVSSSQLAHVFPEETGLPLHRYVVRLRAALALNALEAGTTDLSRLALELGFATHSHFSAVFRCSLGMSPREARQRLTKELL